jgi:hypothetical protein
MQALLSMCKLRAETMSRAAGTLLLASGFATPGLPAQVASTPSAISIPAASVPSNPIAIVPLDSRIPGSASIVTGALQVIGGRAFIATNGTITSGTAATEVALPNRGTLEVCAGTTVKLAADSSVPSTETPGLMMALDHGAIEASFATGRNADTLLTPDFRILIGSPGAANVKVRLGQGGDTCVDNPGGNAPYVLVTSVFDGGVYRVQPGQRVMFQHGSLKEVVDQEKEPCGCPPSEPKGNDFPLAQSEGLSGTPVTNAGTPGAASSIRSTQPLTFNAGESASAASAQVQAPPTPTKPAMRKRVSLFNRIGHFFRRIFGAD